jgi:pyruvate/2-oxoglutarate dehydrogenase complex dihydrolipoamide dehydrogenase (E3) component
MKKRDLVVIGGGAGGLVVASVASQLGLDVVLIEKEKQMGGDCLHFGCVPSKALLKVARVAHTIRTAGLYGLDAHEPVVDMKAVNASVHRAVSTIQKHDSHERFESMGCEVLTGKAFFLDPDTVQVGERKIMAKRFVIATGSSPFVPDIKGLNNIDYITNESIFQLEKLPEHLVILGAGPVGVEMAQAFIRFGCRVTLVEAAARILSKIDADIAETLRQKLAEEGIELVVNKAAVSVKSNDTGIKKVTMQDGSTITGDVLLVAVGRRPVVDGLGFESAGVRFSSRGVKVNARMQTSRRHIYACGDVTGLLPFTHVAEQQAGTVIANLIFRIPKRISYRVIPSVVYTEPECAQVGVNEYDVNDDSGIEIVRFNMSELDRAIAENLTTGFAKLIVKKGRLVGAHIIGPHAGEVIHELALAIQNRMKLSQLTSMVHAYPTYAQINRRAAGQYFRDKLFSDRTRKLVRFLNRWLP